MEQRRKLLQNSEKLSQGLEEASEALLGGDDSDGAAALLAQGGPMPCPASPGIPMTIPASRAADGPEIPGPGHCR